MRLRIFTTRPPPPHVQRVRRFAPRAGPAPSDRAHAGGRRRRPPRRAVAGGEVDQVQGRGRVRLAASTPNGASSVGRPGARTADRHRVGAARRPAGCRGARRRSRPVRRCANRSQSQTSSGRRPGWPCSTAPSRRARRRTAAWCRRRAQRRSARRTQRGPVRAGRPTAASRPRSVGPVGAAGQRAGGQVPQQPAMSDMAPTASRRGVSGARGQPHRQRRLDQHLQAAPLPGVQHRAARSAWCSPDCAERDAARVVSARTRRWVSGPVPSLPKPNGLAVGADQLQHRLAVGPPGPEQMWMLTGPLPRRAAQVPRRCSRRPGR